MRSKTKTYIANGMMIVGVLPQFAMFTYVALISRYHLSSGDTLAAGMAIFLGFSIAYVVTLTFGLPAFLWSRSLATSLNSDAGFALILRRAVVCSLFGISPLLSVVGFWR
jgi:hypothetical protein